MLESFNGSESEAKTSKIDVEKCPILGIIDE